MRALCVLLLASCIAVAAPTRAQDAPGPPAELAKLDRLLGNWEGSGTATMEPGGESRPWTSTSTARKVMNGFFIREDLVIDVGEEAPSPIVFRTFYGFDREQKRFMSCGIGNMGPPKVVEIHFSDPNTMVSIETSIEGGQQVIDRWVTKMGVGSFSFVGERAIGGGEFFVHVQGKMTRAAEPVEARAFAAASTFVPVGPEMERLNRMAGEYRLEGTYQPIPELPPMKVSGSELLAPLFDGAVLEATVVGDEVPDAGTYEAWSAYGWDPVKGCYTSVYVNNMGEIGAAEARWEGARLVSTFLGMRTGQPAASRSVIGFDDEGALATVVVDGVTGALPPTRSFEARFERQ